MVLLGVSPLPEPMPASQGHSELTHLPLVPHICVSESNQHWLGYQCWVIVIWTRRNKLQWNFNQNTEIFIHENASKNFVCEMAVILSMWRWHGLRNILSVHNEETLKSMLSALHTDILNKLWWDFKPTTKFRKIILENFVCKVVKMIIIVCLHSMLSPLTKSVGVVSSNLLSRPTGSGSMYTIIIISLDDLWPLLLTSLTLIPAWISNYMPGKV